MSAPVALPRGRRRAAESRTAPRQQPMSSYLLIALQAEFVEQVVPDRQLARTGA